MYISKSDVRYGRSEGFVLPQVGSHFCAEDRRKPRRFRDHSEIIFPSPFSLSKKTEFTETELQKVVKAIHNPKAWRKLFIV